MNLIQNNHDNVKGNEEQQATLSFSRFINLQSPDNSQLSAYGNNLVKV